MRVVMQSTMAPEIPSIVFICEDENPKMTVSPLIWSTNVLEKEKDPLVQMKLNLYRN